MPFLLLLGGVSKNFIYFPCQLRPAGLGAEKTCEVGEVCPFKLFAVLLLQGDWVTPPWAHNEYVVKTVSI